MQKKKVSDYLLEILLITIFEKSFLIISLKILTVSASESKFEPKILKQSI